MGTKTQIRRLKRIVKLSYLQTVAVVEGSKPTTEFVGEPAAFNESSSNFTGPDFLALMSAGLMGNSGGARTLEFSDTGWVVGKTWLETYWDRIRYAIGIRDISINQFQYDIASEIISKPWSSPKEIEKVSLYVNEIIPNEFPIGPRYIEYYVSADPGTKWLRINPLDHPTDFGDDGSVVPRIINFNTEKPANATNESKYVTTENPVKSVRFRAILKRPEQIEDSVSMTPILRGYRLLLYPKNGLT